VKHFPQRLWEKVAFKTLEEEELETRRQNGEYTGEENNDGN